MLVWLSSLGSFTILASDVLKGKVWSNHVKICIPCMSFNLLFIGSLRGSTGPGLKINDLNKIVIYIYIFFLLSRISVS